HWIETRHSITHGDLPELPILRNTAAEILTELHAVFWSKLDARAQSRNSTTTSSPDPSAAAAAAEAAASSSSSSSSSPSSSSSLRRETRTTLKTFMKARRNEIKSNSNSNNNSSSKSSKSSKSSSSGKRTTDTALKSLLRAHHKPISPALPSSAATWTHASVLAVQLVEEKMLFPSPHKATPRSSGGDGGGGGGGGVSMAGAFLLWDPLLLALAQAPQTPDFASALVMILTMTVIMASRDAGYEWMREAAMQWVLHVLGGREWGSWRRGREKEVRAVMMCCLESCVGNPGVWSGRLARSICALDGKIGEEWAEVVGVAAVREEDGNGDVVREVDVQGMERELEEMSKPEPVVAESAWQELDDWKPVPWGVVARDVEDFVAPVVT
ncbi:hypothetical protein LTS18_014088, partial [Coniosporium uncinatum]